MVMVCVLWATFGELTERAGAFHYDFLADGDNAVVFLEPRVASFVREQFADACSTVCTQELVVEQPTGMLERIPFGQSQPVMTGEGLTMVRNFRKTLSNALVGHRHYDDMRFGYRVLKATAMCERALARGVPVLQPYFERVVNDLHAVPLPENPFEYLEDRYYQTLSTSGQWNVVEKAAASVPITTGARQSFARAFGISPEEQISMEKRLVDGVDLARSRWWVRRWWNHKWEQVQVYDGPDGGTGLLQDTCYLASDWSAPRGSATADQGQW
jgi:hypothetical protein